MNSAIILAAGAGTRIVSIIDDKPKGFLQIGGQSIIERSIQQLIECQIDHIVIVTGYHSEYYDSLREIYPIIQTIKNDQYSVLGSMNSLYLGRTAVDGPFLLLESDLIYETRALDILLNTQLPNAVLLSGKTNSGDEYWVETENGRLRKISTSKSAEENSAGQMVGILKISPDLFSAMNKFNELWAPSRGVLNYEVCLEYIAAEMDVFTCKIDNLIWTEIDDEFQFQRAKQEIYPRILKSENKVF